MPCLSASVWPRGRKTVMSSSPGMIDGIHANGTVDKYVTGARTMSPNLARIHTLVLSAEENALLTQTNAGTPMGQYFRRYWLPALLGSELPEPDCPPVRVRLLGEDLIAFRDSNGRVGLLDEFCPHRRASLFWGRNEDC